LVGIPLPGTTGFTSIQGNLPATVQNTGWELELNTINLQKKLQWSTALNLTIPKNKLIAFPSLEGSTYRNQLVIGEPLNIQKVYNLEGVNPETGLYEFTDVNGDGIISSVEDRQTLVDLSPKYFGGLGNSLSFKGWQLDFLFQFVKQTGRSYTYSGGHPGGMTNQNKLVMNRWEEPGDLVEIQKYTAGGNTDLLQSFVNFQNSTATYSDASFIRLKNISITYKLPKSWTQGLQGLVFLRGQNL